MDIFWNYTIKGLLTKVSVKVSIHRNVQHLFQMFLQISHTPDLEEQFLRTRCGLSAGVNGILLSPFIVFGLT